LAEQYTYAVARIHAMETALLTLKDLEQVLSADNEKEAIAILSDKGFGGYGAYNGAEQLLSEEREKTAELIKKLIPDISQFDVFLYADDFHNLKAAVKAVSSGERDGIFVKGGTINYEVIKKAVFEKEIKLLPEKMQKPCKEALSALVKTGDGQLADIIIDRAALEAIYEAGKNSDNETVKDYAELFVALSDLKIAIRCVRMKKSNEFLSRALAVCDTVDTGKLVASAKQGEDELLEYISYTPYSDCIEAVKKSFTEFEKWCDNKIMSVVAKQKSNPFTIAPIAAYYYARETEIKAVRMVLSAIINDLDENLIKERLRDLYV